MDPRLFTEKALSAIGELTELSAHIVDHHEPIDKPGFSIEFTQPIKKRFTPYIDPSLSTKNRVILFQSIKEVSPDTILIGDYISPTLSKELQKEDIPFN